MSASASAKQDSGRSRGREARDTSRTREPSPPEERSSKKEPRRVSPEERGGRGRREDRRESRSPEDRGRRGRSPAAREDRGRGGGNFENRQDSYEYIMVTQSSINKPSYLKILHICELSLIYYFKIL